MQTTPNVSLKSGKSVQPLKPANDFLHFNENKPAVVDVFSRPNIPSLKPSLPLPLLGNPMQETNLIFLKDRFLGCFFF